MSSPYEAVRAVSFFFRRVAHDTRHYRRGAALTCATLAFFSAAVLLSPDARAQSINLGAGYEQSTSISQKFPIVDEWSAPPPGHLAKDWIGLRPFLSQRGVDLIVDYWGEFGGNITGGTRRGNAYAGQVAAQATLNFAKMFPEVSVFRGLTLHNVWINRHGTSAGKSLLSDSLYNPEQIYGSGGNVFARLVYLYLEKHSMDDRISFAAGRYAIGADFASSPLYCNFMSLSICGAPRGVRTVTGWNSWPQSSWAGRLRWRPTNDIYIQTGAFEANRLHGGTSGFYWRLTDATGVELPVEIGWQPAFGHYHLTGRYRAGVISDTSNYNDLFLGTNGQPYQKTGAIPRIHHGTETEYFLFDQMIKRTGPFLNQGIVIFGGYFHGDPTVNHLHHEIIGGFTWYGINASRPHDGLSGLVTYWQYSGRLGHADELSYQIANTPMSSQFVRGHQTVFELTYNLHLYDGIDISPDIQFVDRPNGTNKISDVVFMGVNSHLSL